MLLAAVFAMVAFIIPTISHEHTWQLVVSGLLTGAGVGLAFSSMSNAIIEAVPAAQTGEAIGVNTITRTIGSSIGTAVIAALLTGHATPQGDAHRRRLHHRVHRLHRRGRHRRRRRVGRAVRPPHGFAGSSCD